MKSRDRQRRHSPAFKVEAVRLMAVSRTKEGGEALMVFSIDSPATSALVDQLHAVGFDDVRFVELG